LEVAAAKSRASRRQKGLGAAAVKVGRMRKDFAGTIKPYRDGVLGIRSDLRKKLFRSPAHVLFSSQQLREHLVK
jgi:hypothetical protein